MFIESDKGCSFVTFLIKELRYLCFFYIFVAII